MLRPLSAFCCGCSVPAGAGIVLVCHLAGCIAFIACACSNLIAGQPTLGSGWSAPSQLVYTGFCLMGLPIILAGLYGVVLRIEANVRMYFYYSTLSFVVNTVLAVYWCLVQNPCDTTGGLFRALSHSFGEAFLCGTLVIASYAEVTCLVAIEVYCLWVVWSLCEDVHQGKNGPELSELIPSKDDAAIRQLQKHIDGPVAGIVGFANSKVPGPYPNPYGAISTTGESGRSIFGGTTHETNYPPAP